MLHATNSSPELLYACGACGSGGALEFYDATQSSGPIESIPFNTAFGVAVDDQRDIYVSINGGDNPALIVELLPGGGRYTYGYDSYWNPLNVAPFAGQNPPIAATNLGSDWLEFPQQSQSATQYSDPNLGDIQPLTVDAAGNVYLAGYQPYHRHEKLGYEVDVVTPDQTITNLNLQLDHVPDALLLDKKGNLLVSEYHKGVALFEPGKTTPTRWFDDVHGGGSPDSIALGGNDERLYVLDGSYIRVLKYPHGYETLWQYSVNHGPGCCQAEIAIDPRPPLFDPTSYALSHPGFRYWTDFGHKRRLGSRSL